MRARLIRALFGAVALGAFWLLLLATAAGVRPGEPWAATKALPLAGADVQTIFGVAKPTTDGLRVEQLGARALGLQTWRVSLQADNFDLLRYRFRGLPRGLNIDLVFRLADHSSDVVTAPLPVPTVSGGVVDLRDLKQWHGRITEIGFSEYPDPQLVPTTLVVRPFMLLGAQLEQHSWSGGLQALFTHWFGYQPWRQSSINSLDEQMAGPLWPMVPVVALGCLGSLIVLGWILGVGWRRAVLIAAIGGWLLLDAHWLVRLAQRHQQTRALYAGKPWVRRQHLQSDQNLVAAAQHIKRVLAMAPRGRQVLLCVADRYARGRLGYHLRPLNVGGCAAGYVALAPLASGALLVVDDQQGRWHFDATSDRLSVAGSTARAQRLWHRGAISLYRIGVEGAR